MKAQHMLLGMRACSPGMAFCVQRIRTAPDWNQTSTMVMSSAIRVSDASKRRTMTRAELESKCRSLHSVGGLYEIIALTVWEDNAQYCDDTGGQ